MAPPSVHPFVKAVAKKVTPQAQEAAAVAAYGQATGLPDLIAFTGFLGPTIDQPAPGDQAAPDGQPPPARTWRMLYLDLELRTWLLVEDDEILVNEKVEDRAAPSGRRDMIWVTADAPVGHGSGSPSVEARFLTGDFTRAGDFEAPPAGGTLSAATGVFCNARTAGCCRRKSQ
jgi:hypothetical protein